MGTLPQAGEKQPYLELKEYPGLYYKEMCEAGALGFIQSAPVPLRALYDRNMMDDPNTDFDNLPEVPEIKLDEHQYAVIKQMAKERRTFELELDIRNHFKLGPIKYHNVIASIKVRDKAPRTSKASYRVRWNRRLGFCGGRGADNRLHDR